MKMKSQNLSPEAEIRLRFLTNGIDKNQNYRLESGGDRFYKDQNVNHLGYLEKAFQIESNSTCPWVLAFWLQNGSQASQTGCQVIHNPVR